MTTSSQSPVKRARDSNSDKDGDSNHSPLDSTTVSGESSKRVRRTRWEPEDTAETRIGTLEDAKAKLSDVVVRLAAVVKEQMSPEQLAVQSTAPGLAPPPYVDADAAKARALAQASLLSLKLPVTPHVAPGDLAKRLYIGNLYYELREDDIRNTFAPFGSIKSIDLSLEPGQHRSKGFCFLEYDDVLAAESAVQLLNGSMLSNRTIRVGRPHRGSANPGDPNIGLEAIKLLPTKCVYIGNVRVELNSHHLESIFSPFGTIRTCVMAALSPLEASVHRGYGFIEFTDDASAANAIQHMHGFELAGQHLKVGKASPLAIELNVAVSADKVVRDANGELSINAADGAHSHAAATKSHAAFDDDDVDAVKDVAESSSSNSTNNAAKRCLCLLNMVNKGEVDDELEDEVRDECSRFGNVERVSIQELDDHVRVFVVFHDHASAVKGKQALHGRFFGGNQVQAHYYAVDELAAMRYRSAFL